MSRHAIYKALKAFIIMSFMRSLSCCKRHHNHSHEFHFVSVFFMYLLKNGHLELKECFYKPIQTTSIVGPIQNTT